jgi:TPP-dependent pyruvate/acetoin dehydrogenase alpha subunit
MSDHLINIPGTADSHEDGTEPAALDDSELRESLYRRMLLIRRFEERVYRLFLEGEIPGTLHQYQGQEAVAVGVCDVLTHDDWITSTHRPHGHALAKGVSTRAAMAELYGRRTGCCGGKGGSMHLGDPEVGMLPAIAIVGGGNTVVTGLGLAMKLRRRRQVAVCFFGDGATNEGAFHEGINFAAVERLPVVLVCENNLYGASTPYGRVALVPDVAERAKAYGVPARIVDGMDVMAVREAARDAVAAARAHIAGMQDLPVHRAQPQ